MDLVYNFEYNFIVELSRKCNLYCSHCCRGDTQKRVIDFYKLKHFLKHVNYIHCLHIGGGEPSIVKDQLEKLYKLLLNCNTKIGSVYVVTNGVKNTKWLSKWFMRFTENVCINNEKSAMAFSFDIYHNEAINTKDNREYNFSKAKGYVSSKNNIPVFKHSTIDMYFPLIKKGRAESHGSINIYPVKIHADVISGTVSIKNIELYWTVDGNILSNCNLSYKEMNSNSPFFVADFDLLKKKTLLEYIYQYNSKI